MSRFCSRTFSFFLIFTLLSCASEYQSPVDIDFKPESVKRKFKTITLKNNLRAILISDPEVKLSSAAINVNVGYGEDPIGQDGMAHFLEHMLFLGTKKYPSESDYNQYLGSNQGGNNAYTTFDNTNYFLEVNPQAFQGALDRFSQFFIAPLFTPKYVDREKQAVNNEFQKNKLNDTWRLYEVAKQGYTKDHPERKFGTGNAQTLKSISRESLISWYNAHYSANVMTLALLGPQSISDLEKMANQYFSQVPDRNITPPKYSQDVLPKTRQPKITHIMPIKDSKSFKLTFFLPSQLKNYKDKSFQTISTLFGSEHKGGLTSYLKNQGLINSLYSRAENKPHQLELSISMELTDKGANSYQDIITAVFSYIDFLKKQDFPKSFFYEQKAISEIYYVYPRFEEGGGYAAHMAALLQSYGDDALKKAYVYYEPSPKKYFELLNLLTKERAQFLLSHKNFRPSKTEKIYGVQYHYEPFKKPSPNLNQLAYKMPPPNKYIPSDLALKKYDSMEAKLLVKNRYAEFWFKPDDKIKLPRGNITGRLLSEEPSQSPEAFVRNQLYVKLLNHHLADWADQLYSAGIYFRASPSFTGLRFTLDGFSDKIPEALQAFLASLDKVRFDKKVFADEKIIFLRNLKNSEYNSAYQLAVTKLNSEMNRYTPFPLEIINVAKKIKLEDINKHHNNFRKKFLVQAAAYGNLDIPKIQKTLGELKQLQKPSTKFLASAYLAPSNSPSIKIKTKDNNDAWTAVKLIGKRDPVNEAFTSLLTTFISDQYYNDLRTNQQLGYIVSAFSYKDPENVGVQFLIQSSDYKSKELSNRTKNWLTKERKRILSISDEEFLKVKKGLVSNLEKPFKTSSEYAEQLYLETFVINKPNYREEMIKEIKKMDAKTFKSMAGKFITKSPHTLSIFVDKPQKP